MKLRPRSGAILLLVVVPLACDAFTPPEEFTDFDGFDDGVTSGVFCPEASFDVVTTASALSKPLFAWITSEERAAIEAGGPVLPSVPTFGASGGSRLVAAMHDSLPAWSIPEHPLVGQPRIGRSFWPFAFSAPRESEDHDELLVVRLRADAWFTTHPPNYLLIDASSNFVYQVDLDESPGRVAGVDTTAFANCLRDGAPERGLVVFREEAIERIGFGEEPRTLLEGELAKLQSILTQVRAESHLNPSMAFDYLACGNSESFVLCSENTYVQAVPWPTPTYLPTIAALSSQIDRFRALPETPSTIIDRTGPDDLEDWTAAWPGSWREPAPGYGGAGGSSGLGGSGG